MTSRALSTAKPALSPRLARVAATLLVVGGLTAAALVPVPRHIPAVALNSPWVFRGMIFTLVPLIAALVWAVWSSFASGLPFQTLSFLGITLDHVKQAAGNLTVSAVELEEARQSLAPGDLPPDYAIHMENFYKHLAAIEEMVGE